MASSDEAKSSCFSVCDEADGDGTGVFQNATGNGVWADGRQAVFLVQPIVSSRRLRRC